MDGNAKRKGGEGRDGHPRTHPRYSAYVLVSSLFSSKLLERRGWGSLKNNRGSSRVSDTQIIDTFLISELDLIILK